METARENLHALAVGLLPHLSLAVELSFNAEHMINHDMRILLFLIIFIHGIIHLMSFTKAFKWAEFAR